MRVGEQLGLVATDLDLDGAGVSYAPHVHVAGALPGERVTATVAHVSPHRLEAWARLDRVETASPDRRAPDCPAFGPCGGCVLQHYAYEAQLAWKRAQVARALGRFPALAGLPVGPTVPSPRQLGYRNKSKLVAATAGGAFVLGAYAERTHDVVDLDGCRIVETALDRAAGALRRIAFDHRIAPYDERRLTGELRHVVLRSNHQGQVLAALVVARPLASGEIIARALIDARPNVVGVVEQVNRGRGNAIFDDRAGAGRALAGTPSIDDRLAIDGRPLRLRLSAQAFFQANREVAALAYAAIVRALAPRADDAVVDAYCGVGGIALSLAGHAATVTGVETNASAIAYAEENAKLNGIANARFVAGDAAARLAGVARADGVVLNPPRKGCSAAVLTEVVRVAPRTVAYLSCNPETLARDLALLTERGYRVREVTPFDMLPHTPHVEALAVVDRLRP